MNRRNWIQSLSAMGAGAMLLDPRELLAITPDYRTYHANNGDMAQLSFNENPYSPSPKMKESISKLDPDLCRYPFAHINALEKKIAEKEGLSPENIVVCSGSREGLNAVGLKYGLQGGEVLSCIPTYLALLNYSEQFGSKIRALPLNQEMEFDLKSMEKNINADTKLIFVCNPNNPTGTKLDDSVLESFCLRASEKSTVFVDEVYKDYVEDGEFRSMKHLVDKTNKLIISRTFSKVYGLAGIRVGYLIVPASMSRSFREILMSGTNVLACMLASTALEDESFYQYSLAKNRQAKQIMYSCFEELGLRYIRSHANFVFFNSGRDIQELRKSYADRGVDVGRPFPPYNDWCRVSTGRIEDVELFARVTRDLFS